MRLSDFVEAASSGGRYLSLEEYEALFLEILPRSVEFFKTESRQSFMEPQNDSLQAFMSGEFSQSLSILRAQALEADPLLDRAGAGSISATRLRLVETPLSRYLEWELVPLAIRDVRGERTLLVVREVDGHANFGELVALDRHLFSVDYDGDGLARGARYLELDDAAYLGFKRVFAAEQQEAIPILEFLKGAGSAGSRFIAEYLSNSVT